MVSLEPGHVVDRYVVEAVIGKGGMATVYRVRHLQLDSHHALKVLNLMGEPVRVRLLREGRVQATMRHPNLVAVTDLVDVNGAPGLIMELVKGPSLKELLSEGRLALSDAEELAQGIMLGVIAAHDQALVHRDLKPANILLSTAKVGGLVPKITDFGLVKVLTDSSLSRTRSGCGMGTPQYMSPEQARDAKRVDRRADIFSLGAILYELVCGVRAFPERDKILVLNTVAAGHYRDPKDIIPDLPDRIVLAIRGALQSDRNRRIPDGRTLLAMWRGEDPTDITAGWAELASVEPAPEAAAGITFEAGQGMGVGEVRSGRTGQPGDHDSPGREPQATRGNGGAQRGTCYTTLAPDLPEAPTSPVDMMAFLADGHAASRPGMSTPAAARELAWASPSSNSMSRWVWIVAVMALATASMVAVTRQRRRDLPSAAPRAVDIGVTAEPRPELGPVEPVEAPKEPVALVEEPVALVEEPVEEPDGPVEEPDGPVDAPEKPSPATPPRAKALAGTGRSPSKLAPRSVRRPAAAADPNPSTTTVTVVLKGDAKRLWLTGPAGDFAAGQVPPGTYTVKVFFGGAEPVEVGRISLAVGDKKVITCSSALLACRY